jgi:Zn ribbon nucleic-acid-binding protein
MRCPDCDAQLGDDVEDWLISRRRKIWECPYCGWHDYEKKYKINYPMGDSRFYKYARKVA